MFHGIDSRSILDRVSWLDYFSAFRDLPHPNRMLQVQVPTFSKYGTESLAIIHVSLHHVQSEPWSTYTSRSPAMVPVWMVQMDFILFHPSHGGGFTPRGDNHCDPQTACSQHGHGGGLKHHLRESSGRAGRCLEPCRFVL